MSPGEQPIPLHEPSDCRFGLSRRRGLRWHPLTNTSLLISIVLMVYLFPVGPTYFLMNGIVEGIGAYLTNVIPQGFRTYTFFEEAVEGWFIAWTLNYMVWWLAWSPFVGYQSPAYPSAEPSGSSSSLLCS